MSSRARFLLIFNDQAHFRRFLIAMTFVTFLAGIGVMFIPQAWAASFSCSGGSGNGNLFDQDVIGSLISDRSGGAYTINTGTAVTNGDPFSDSGACPSSLGIFGSILCFFKVTVGQIVSNMYCSIQQNLLQPFSMAIELFIVIFGVTVMTGMIQFTPREAITTLLKVALVWAFATNATWGIGVGYSFFIGIAEQGSNLVLNAIGTASGSNVSGGGGYLTQPDNLLNGFFSLVSTGNGGSLFPTTLTTTCAVWMITFLILLLLFVPMVGGFLITMMIQYVMLYVRAFLGYLTSLVLISFLFVLSPIFICFALFEITRPMFEQWFKNLLSFSLQMIIIFAFLVLLQMIPIGAFFTEMLSLLREYDTVGTTFTYNLPMTFCSICDYTIGSGNISDTPPPITCSDNNAIPIGKLFLDTDLVQAVLSQIVALWIVGVVMQDFLKQAPTFASAITGGMPMLSMDAQTGGQGVQYMGLDSGWSGGGAIDSSENLAGIRDTIESYRSKISPRAAPLILTGALLLGNAASQANNAKTAGSGSGSGSAAGSPTKTGKTSASKVTTTTVLRGLGGGPTMATSGTTAGAVLRPTLNSSKALMNTASDAQANVLGATEYLKKVNDESAGEVQKALQVVEKYRSESGVAGNEKAYQEAMLVLQHANATWMAALTNLSQRNQELLAKKESKSEVNPGTAMSGATPNVYLADITSKDQVRDQINLSINTLQLQIQTRQAMLSKDDKNSAEALDNIQAELDKVANAATDPAAMNTSEGLTDVITQLTTVEKMLS